MSRSIHQFKVNNLSGEEVSLADYAGKVLLIVNTASKCGFTPQLRSLETLRTEIGEEQFEILGFPSDDFAGQEPLNGAEIGEFCEKNYGVTFPVFEKVHVKGDQTCELYQFLSDKNNNGQVNSKPKWNFHKYLIDKEGQVVDYFYTITSPTAGRVKRAIRKLLN